MKIVINNCYGGFCLSEKAINRYLKLKGIKLTEEKETLSKAFIYNFSDNVKRNDPFLIQVIEELGTEANGDNADLILFDIENGRWYKIKEYDGLESVIFLDMDEGWELAK